MSEREQKLLDVAGDYLYAVRDGEVLDSPAWHSCRIVLTNERLVLSTSDNKQAIAHPNIYVPEGDDAVPAAFDTDAATPLKIGDHVILVDAQQVDDFESEYCRAALHDEVILVRSRAVVGGVVQDDATWSKARFRLDDDQIHLALPEDQTVEFAIDNVGTVETESQQVMGDRRQVVKVEHTDESGHSVETHFSGVEWHSRALESLLQSVIEDRQDDYELSDEESQVLMALYSGVSPFEMADFVGLPVDEVEEIYQNLLDVGAVDKVRERTEVTLNAQGRNMASEEMNER
ncbi:CheF family chemotaxis protein [Halovenus marina]|uniref:CheF family chemotaxis protein n=1 Tax=Halovenus marina TaxID=3396621 RepID=UPI003F571BCA